MTQKFNRGNFDNFDELIKIFSFKISENLSYRVLSDLSKFYSSKSAVITVILWVNTYQIQFIKFVKISLLNLCVVQYMCSYAIYYLPYFWLYRHRDKF